MNGPLRPWHDAIEFIEGDLRSSAFICGSKAFARITPHRQRANLATPMKVIILGAGVAGVASAWYFWRDGHEVTVLERNDGVALETSFANGGQLSYSYVAPLASASVHPEDSAVAPAARFAAALPPGAGSRPMALDRWSSSPRATRRTADDTTQKLLRLAFYSRDLMHELVRDARARLRLRAERQARRAHGSTARSSRRSASWSTSASSAPSRKRLDAKRCVEIEPALERSMRRRRADRRRASTRRARTRAIATSSATS